MAVLSDLAKVGVSSDRNVDYVAQVNRAIDYVTEHLDRPLRLEEVARAACFSPYHFHRIFRALAGETLAAFVKRVRLERAVYLLSHRPKATLTEIGLSCGFGSSSDFSRAFRAQYGVAPRTFDVEGFRRAGRDEMRAKLSTAELPHRLEALPVGNGADGTPAGNRADGMPAGGATDGFEVKVRRAAARRVAYIRVRRPYEGDGVVRATDRLMAWAEARGLADGQWLGYQWDDPELVALEKCRYDVGLEVPEGVRREGEMGVTSFPACLMAEIEIKGSVELELRALQWLYRDWLPASGYLPAHQPMFEVWDGRPFAHGMEHFEIRIQLALTDEPLEDGSRRRGGGPAYGLAEGRSGGATLGA